MANLTNPAMLHAAVIGQQNRLLRLTTPLGVDVMLPQRALAYDRLSRGYEYNIDCLSIHGGIELKS